MTCLTAILPVRGINGNSNQIELNHVNNRRNAIMRNKKKTKLPDVPENNIPDEVHLKAGMFAKAFMKLPPVTEKELKEKLKDNK